MSMKKYLFLSLSHFRLTLGLIWTIILHFQVSNNFKSFKICKIKSSFIFMLSLLLHLSIDSSPFTYFCVTAAITSSTHTTCVSLLSKSNTYIFTLINFYKAILRMPWKTINGKFVAVFLLHLLFSFIFIFVQIEKC